MTTRIIGVVVLVLLLASPAAAHSLRVFAKVEGNDVAGYGFFVGGGRPHGALWSARMGGSVVATGQTDAEGAFAFPAPQPVTDDVIVTVDTREGHIASATLAPARFGGSAAPSATATSAAAGSTAASAPAPTASAPAAPQIAALVETAVERQLAPLLERIEAMDARLRFADILSGVFLIFGLAGMGLWALGRRK